MSIEAYEPRQELSRPIGTAIPADYPGRITKAAKGSTTAILTLPKAAAATNKRYGVIVTVNLFAVIQGQDANTKSAHKVARIALANNGTAWALNDTPKTDDWKGGLMDLALTVDVSTGDAVFSVGSATADIEIYGDIEIKKMPRTNTGIPE